MNNIDKKRSDYGKNHNYSLRWSKYMEIELEKRPYTAKELKSLGFTSPQISRASKNGYLLQLDRGLYEISELGLSIRSNRAVN